MTKSKWDSVFLSNLHYFYAKTDGTYEFPNSAEGDLLKQAKKEIEAFYTQENINEVICKAVEEALERRVPKQPVIHLTYSKTEATHCPQCDVQVKEYLKYCWNCGQKLDWSEYEKRS